MSSYPAALDDLDLDLDREAGDGASIGLILCREHNRVVVDYAPRHIDVPIGVARYKLMLVDSLLAALADALPTAEDLELGMLPDEAIEDG